MIKLKNILLIAMLLLLIPQTSCAESEKSDVAHKRMDQAQKICEFEKQPAVKKQCVIFEFTSLYIEDLFNLPFPLMLSDLDQCDESLNATPIKEVEEKIRKCYQRVFGTYTQEAIEICAEFFPEETNEDCLTMPGEILLDILAYYEQGLSIKEWRIDKNR